MSERDRDLLLYLQDLEATIYTRRYSKAWRCCRRARGGVRRKLHELLARIR